MKHHYLSFKSSILSITQFLLLIAMVFISSTTSYAQCTDCDVTLDNYSSSSNFTFTAGQNFCFTGNNTISNDITFENNASICIAPGATLNISANNFSSSSSDNFTIDIYGTLIINTGNATWNNNLTLNIHTDGLMTTKTLHPNWRCHEYC